MSDGPVFVTEKMQQDMLVAVAAFLKANNYPEAFRNFCLESGFAFENVDLKAHAEDMPRKFATTSRLMTKLETLQNTVKALQAGNLTDVLPSAEKRKRDEGIPRSPELYNFKGHRSEVSCAAFNPIYQICATGSEDATVRVWNLRTAACVMTITGHTLGVTDVAFNANGKLLATASLDFTAKVWDCLNDYVCITTIRGHNHVVSSIAFTPKDLLLTASRDTYVKLWDIKTVTADVVYSGSGNWIRVVRVHPNGVHFAVGSNHAVVVYGFDNNEPVATLNQHRNVVETLAWAPSTVGKLLGLKDAVPVENEDTGIIIPGKPLVLATGGRDYTIKLWHVNFGVCLQTIESHSNWVTGVVFHPNGRYLLSVSDDRTLRVFNMPDRREERWFVAHDQFVTSVDVHNSEPYVVTAAKDNTVKIWECR